MKRVLQEALLIAALGAALAFAANALSPRGLQLGKNYFPAPAPAVEPSPGTTNSSPLDALAARFSSEGLQLADSNRVMNLFRDPRRGQDLVIFIDARNDEHYLAGHIPGAYQFDRFHPDAENRLATILPLCQNAQQIVFYCNGGDCEDSEHTAIYLRDGIGLPKEKVFVYGGGITEWESNGLPVEIGSRNSGNITNFTRAAAGSAPGVAK